ncbi:hypothetical protein [Microcystis phage Mae-Yong924-2]|nr:hypothetical protein [Microcystis phage Mea-Yong924-1]QYC50731.1 hypothetical protein [Microcystis phage Mae-Yong924-2]
MGKTAETKGAASAAPSMAELLEKALIEAGAPAEDIQTLVEYVNAAETSKQLLEEAKEAFNAKEEECIKLREQVEAQETELETARETLKELQEQLSTVETKAAAKADEIVVAKETYLVDAGNFKFKGEVVNATILKDNPKLAQELIDLGVGFIKKKGA